MEGNLKQKTVLIVGAGIGGIATAARLAKNGYRVTVVEKCERSGGRCGQMILQGYRFDTGATLFMMPELYAETYAALGESMNDLLDLKRVNPTYHLYFQDNSQLQLTSDLHEMMGQVEAIEPGSFEHLLHYLAEGRRHYELSLSNVITRDFRNLVEFINPRMVPIFFRLNAFTQHAKYVSRFFESSRLQTAFTFQDMYMGLSPYESPATYSFMQYTELSDGLFFPIGGMYRIAETLTASAEKLGVRFLYNSPVDKILVEGERATGVVLSDGQRIIADILVANADLGYVYRNLLPDDGEATRIDRKEYGCSAVMFYWGLDKQFPQLGPHNLFFSGDYRKGFEDIFKGNKMPEQPNFYIHAPTRMDTTAAPAGCDTLYVAVPVGHISTRNPQDWPSIQAQARAFILNRLSQVGMADLESHIKVEVEFGPQDWQRRYNLTRGSAHGLSHKLTQMAYFRPHNRHKHYRNLYFVGASTHPGTGVPTVLVSARLTAQRILDDTGN
ncbi:MAG: phytoene desaturase family protein [Anaerolineales bacterium]